MIHAMDAIATVFGYIACTVPCVGLLVWILQLRSVHAREFQVALFLQLLPVGLLYWPLGVPGVAILGSCIWRGGRRMRQFRVSGLYNPSVEKAWSLSVGGAKPALRLGLGVAGLCRFLRGFSGGGGGYFFVLRHGRSC